MSMSFSVNKICCNSLWPSPHNKNNWVVCKKTSNMIMQSHWVINSAIPHLKLNHNFLGIIITILHSIQLITVVLRILEQLKRYGASGVLSYGLLNTAYYLTTFLLVWFYFAPAPGKMGYLAAVSRFLKVMAMVWAGSQVTKL
ncbi:uncharacterized protein LOC110696931 [Chenopodium quinoa]|uniref:uncharacterized protein LOC110696931 n=1 Tax=Chenopodium quinoa TaxID=63459 RepID=UPI000B76C87B|nr:uncharacterized protein LOC110696931 [Chenopodium quinoa]